jgi:radical SAM enzyme (TIGR01210 family)
VSIAAEGRRLRSLRPAKSRVDPWRPQAVLVEAERGRDGRLEEGITLILTGRECPFTCIYCDLWRHTLDQPTPVGAIPAQIERALASHPAAGRSWIKLYNASNFFDRKAVPPADRSRIVELLEPFDRVVVECHPRLVGRDCLEFSGAVRGRLEVAMGLETVHPEVLPRLNKEMDLELFAAACARLRSVGAAVRAFILVGLPWIDEEESAPWAARSVEWAAARGVETTVLIPMRGGNGEMERLQLRGEWRPPTLRQFEEAVDRSLESAAGTSLLADLWDLDRLTACPRCRGARVERLARINRGGTPLPPIVCAACAPPPGDIGSDRAARGARGEV